MTEFWDRRAKQFLVISGILLLLFAFLQFAKYFSDILIILGISILIAYLLIGPVDLLTKIVKIRAFSVMLVYLFLISLIVSLFIFLVPKVIKEFGEFTTQIPEIICSLNNILQKVEIRLNRTGIPVSLPPVTEGISSKLSNLSTDSLTNILGAALNTFHIIFYVLITTVISYYFLLDGHKIVNEFTKHIPSKYQHHIHKIVIELDKCLRGFYGGMVKLAAINATVMFMTYLIMKLPYALLLALWHFLSCIIPVVGGWIGLIPAILVVGFVDPFKIWIPLVVYEGFTRLIKDNFITPRIMSDAIGINPVLVLIAILVGLKAAGLVGVLFALPIFGVINVIFKYSLEQLSKK
ncbi:MAG: hypothetical protein A3B68_00695 [Candidatus Melainabacteria bacterium RIFCSPHIGHO2_02_FULL_34_12]|nr:MAG: hypothetical protein A3B68_00695 [Candidatus Melainabacteria bacterium RIFCSPHIGHO2_02_FULL_34_12]